ncbi:MAG: fimbrillin family protein [Bacteroidales bacterium]|jgi:hypothetical protein|nr:fimbrillin family protein [Bacteroidales bacterium]
MKKSLFILATAAIALASCNNDVKIAENKTLGNNPQEIAFFPLSQKSARLQAPAKAPVQGTVFPNQSMEVTAYQSAGIETPANYFAKTTFSQDGSTGIWKGSRYWPLSPATINFFAVTGEATANITIDDDLSVANVDYSTNNQSDIMYAFGRGAVEQNGNALVFPANVPMAFKHALALINFQIKGSTAIKVKSITIDNAHYTGDLELANSGATAASGNVGTTVTWTPDDSEGSYTVPNITNYPLTGSYYPTNANPATATDWANVMIIPTQQAGSTISYGFKTFTITYCIVNNSGDGPDQTYTYAPSGYTAGVANLTAVNAGYKYTYQINMTLHEIEIVPSVTAWADGGTEVVEIPETIAYSASGSVDVKVPTLAGTYVFTVSGVPADTYSIGEGSTGDDALVVNDSPAITPATLASEGSIKVSVTVTGSTGSARTRPLELKETTGGTVKMTFNIKQD